jgi:hypothetical protein
MKTQYENRVVSSFLLWLDHTILKKGEAFTNFGSDFFSVNSLYQNYHTWGAPYKQFVADASIPNVQVPTALNISGSSVNVGSGPLAEINYNEGQAYFHNPIVAGQVSGDYSVKDFSTYLTNKAEQELLFETKISLRNSTTQEVTGLAPNVQTYPAIFVKNNGGSNEAFSFGGEEKTQINLRAVILADSQFNLDAACSIMKDSARSEMAVFTDDKYPFNTLGGLKNGVYNYDSIVSTLDDNVFVRNVEVSRYNLGYMEGFTNSNPDVFRAIVDFELEDHRFPRA